MLHSGMWLSAADKRVEYAECVYSIDERDDGKALRLLCPTKQIRSRGDTLNCPTLTVDLRAEYENVLSVEVTHWHGEQRRSPNFDLFPDGRPGSEAAISEVNGSQTLRSGALEATTKVDHAGFSITFQSASDGKLVTALDNRSVGFAYAPPPGNMKETESISGIDHFTFTQTELAVGESVHGLGERFGAFNKVGQNVRLWNEDGYVIREQREVLPQHILTSN
jgi:alpha-D-xyloside xylohydrolase